MSNTCYPYIKWQAVGLSSWFLDVKFHCQVCSSLQLLHHLVVLLCWLIGPLHCLVCKKLLSSTATCANLVPVKVGDQWSLKNCQILLVLQSWVLVQSHPGVSISLARLRKPGDSCNLLVGSIIILWSKIHVMLLFSRFLFLLV